MAASVTATLAHFVVAGLAGFAAVWFLDAVDPRVAGLAADIRLPGPNSIYLAWMGVVVAGAVVVSAHQYVTRRRSGRGCSRLLCFVVAQATLIVVRNTPPFDPAVGSSRTYTPPAGVEVRLGDRRRRTNQPALRAPRGSSRRAAH